MILSWIGRSEFRMLERSRKNDELKSATRQALSETCSGHIPEPKRNVHIINHWRGLARNFIAYWCRVPQECSVVCSKSIGPIVPRLTPRNASIAAVGPLFTCMSLSYGGASEKENRLNKYNIINRISIWAKFRPRQLRGAWANGENRRDCGFAAAIGHPTLATSVASNLRFGLNSFTSSPQSSGFLCRDQLTIFTNVPFGSVTGLPPVPTIVSSYCNCLKVPLATAGHRRKVSVIQRSKKGRRDKSRYVKSRSPSSLKKSSTSSITCFWNCGCLASSNNNHVIVCPVVSWPAKRISNMLP
mmetsp:Transcript_12628/g.20907  ORF Transcript_12628/g.20907 Transcript_12628/m.20907 type:complete len:300 (-) Transcript_12628:1185-2084(-)